jgi:hypothetical protein
MLLQQLQLTRLQKKGGNRWLEVTKTDWKGGERGRGGKHVRSMLKSGKNRAIFVRLIGQYRCMRNRRRKVGRRSESKDADGGLDCRVRDGENYGSGKSVNTINIHNGTPYIESKRQS